MDRWKEARLNFGQGKLEERKIKGWKEGKMLKLNNDKEKKRFGRGRFKPRRLGILVQKYQYMKKKYIKWVWVKKIL